MKFTSRQKKTTANKVLCFETRLNAKPGTEPSSPTNAANLYICSFQLSTTEVLF